MQGTMGVRETKERLSQLLERVKEGRTYQIAKHGKPVAILTGIENYNMLLERLEDLEDLLDAREAMKEPSRPFEEFVSEHEHRESVQAQH